MVANVVLYFPTGFSYLCTMGKKTESQTTNETLHFDIRRTQTYTEEEDMSKYRQTTRFITRELAQTNVTVSRV